MPDTLTSNYDLVKPEINGSPNTWGNKLNSNSDIIDTNLKRVDDLATDSVLRAGSGVDPDNYIREVLRYKDTVTPSDPLDLINVALVKAWVTNASPIGSIIPWGGTIASIPVCWSLCDGRTENGKVTPNLVDRFVMGAGGSIVPGTFGGTKTHNHGGGVGATALTILQLPSHNHGVNDPGHLHTVNDPGHNHYTTFPWTGVAAQGGGFGALLNQTGSGFSNVNTVNSFTGITVSSAVTGISTQSVGGGNSHGHTIASVDHTPPYYALAYLMRTKYPWDA